VTVLTTADAARELDVSRRKVYQLARDTKVGYLVAGRSGWRFTLEEVERMRDHMRPVEIPGRRRRRRR
jgi:excisionase family DNA binding protein